MFPGCKRVTIKDLLLLRPTKPNEYFLYDALLDNEDRQFRVFQLDTGNVFGISAIVEESLVLKQVLKDPKKYQVYLHDINDRPNALERVYKLRDKYPKVMEIPRSSVTVGMYPMHGKVNYLLAIGKRNRVSIQKNIIYEVPMQLQRSI